MRPLLFFVASVVLLVLPLAGQAQRLLRWNGTPSMAAANSHDSGLGGWLRLEPASGGFQAWVENPWPGPAQVRLVARDNVGFEAVPSLPATAVLAAGERRVVARLYRIQGDTAGLGLEVQAVPGDPRALPDGQLYRLPFAQAPVRIDQGFDGAFSHHDLANRYALDFALAEGTPVLAAREGIVLQVEDGFREGGPERVVPAGGANQVRILHRDGSMAVYAHLAPAGITVRPGQWVKVGEQIARSGHTGLSTAPHLHFAVQVNAGLRLAGIPFRMVGPLGELQLPHGAPPASPGAR
ncbi:MAG TPA: M23 family metallopeptidase [Stenotrophomonas sp.]|nr:M23 family metallopeptidase [Stenotrophomonas sp.]